MGKAKPDGDSRRRLLGGALAALGLGPRLAQALGPPPPPQVVFINPGLATESFWQLSTRVMQVAARDLNIDLEVQLAGRDRVLMQELALSTLKRSRPPHYLIVVNEKLAAGPIIEAAQASAVKVFIVVNGFVGDQLQRYGQPRERYPRWIGQLLPDNFYTGYESARLLIQRGLADGPRDENGRLALLAIAGDQVTPASTERLRGLQRALLEAGDTVSLAQVVYGEWERARAAELSQRALARYPQLGAMWAANDAMGLGAIDGAIASGRVPGQDLWSCGAGGTQEALQAVEDGSFVTTISGHFAFAAWALVQLFDYHYGRDFAEVGVQPSTPMLVAVQSSNLVSYRASFGGEHWERIDFRRHSRVLNAQRRQYDFSLDAIRLKKR